MPFQFQKNYQLRPILQPSRNQPIDLYYKQIKSFLDDGNNGLVHINPSVPGVY